jgi:hypothetical protein
MVRASARKKEEASDAGTPLTSSGHLLLPFVPVAAHPLCRRRPSPGRTAHCTAGRRVCAEGGGDRLKREETRPWGGGGEERRERGEEREMAYIFLTRSRSRFYCGCERGRRDGLAGS